MNADALQSNVAWLALEEIIYMYIKASEVCKNAKEAFETCALRTEVHLSTAAVRLQVIW
jgi:hypothetical protein